MGYLHFKNNYMEDKKKKNEGEYPELEKLNIQGDTYLTTFTKKYRNRHAWVQPNHKLVISFIPGTIREVFIREGDTVMAEQKIAILEAMKMMNTIYAPISGKVKSLKIAVGDCIPKGTVMVEFE